MASMNRKSAVAMIEKAGGHYVRYPSRNTDFLVIGGLPLRNDGRPTLCLSKARELQKKGHSIQITTETEFLQTLGRQKEINELHHLYTATQLQHILGLSRSQLRYWLRIKLIQPTKLARRLALFDMQEVMRARALHNLIASGVKAAAIRHSLADMSQWLPDTQRMLILLERSDHEGSLRVRLPNGRTADTNGQLLLGLANPGETEEPLDEEGPFELIDPEAADRWFAAGVIAEETGKLDEAVDAYENALLAGGPHTETCFNLGNILDLADRHTQALALHIRALEIRVERLGNEHPEVRRSQGMIGGVCQRWTQVLEQELSDRKVKDQQRRTAVAAYIQMGAALLTGGYLEPAANALNRALKLSQRVYGKNNIKTAEVLTRLGEQAWLTGDPAKALPHLIRALEIRSGSGDQDEAGLADLLEQIGLAYRDTGDFTAGLDYFQRCLSLRTRSLGPVHPDVGQLHSNIGGLHLRAGHPQEAVVHTRRALEIIEEAHGVNHLLSSRAWSNHGTVLLRLGRTLEAIDCLKRSYEILEQVLGRDDQRTRSAGQYLERARTGETAGPGV